MNRFSVFKVLSITIGLAFSSFAEAKENLLIYVFKNGLVQENIKVVVNAIEHVTDSYGKAEFELPQGDYEIVYFKSDQQFAATTVRVLEDVQSQVFLRLHKDGVDAELDLPFSELKQEFEQDEVKPLNKGPKSPLTFRVLSSTDQIPVEGAKVYFKGYELEGVSDSEGLIKLELPAGSYYVSVVHPKYVMSVQKDLQVKADQENIKQILLSPSDYQMEEYVVNAPLVEGALASAIIEMRDSTTIGDALSSAQFSKSGDSSVADALKRVTGVTIVDDKYVYIRGLGERYTTILFNDMHIPSPEPTKRVVPLDIFPTNVIQNMIVQKTWSSDLPGTFAGGTVLLKSKDIPKEDNYVTATIGIEYTDSTGDEAMIGADNSKPLPGIILDFSEDFGVLTEEVKLGNTVLAPGITAEEKEAINYAMVNYREYGLDKQTIDPGVALSIGTGQAFKTSGGLKYGFAGTAYYSAEEDITDIVSNRYQYVESTDSTIHLNKKEFSVATLNEKVGALVSFGLEDSDHHSLKYTYLWLNEATDQTYFGDRYNIIDDDAFTQTYLTYVEEEVTAHQLNGTSYFLQKNGIWFYDEIQLDWGVEIAEATRLEPGTFEYDYKEETSGFVLDAKSLFYLYSDLQDEVDNQRVDITLPFEFNNQRNFTKIGYFNYDKKRDLDNRRFKVEYQDTFDQSAIDDALTVGNVDNGTLDILDSYKADDFYTAEQTIKAYYFTQLISVVEALDITFGARFEDSRQVLQVGEAQDEYELETSDTLPSFGGTYRLSDDKQIRFGYSETITRPDFREYSPNRYKDPLTDYIVSGYPELEATYIDNFDLKFEWYPSYDEYFSIGLFSKEFTNPIETFRSQVDVDIDISYRNTESATSNGFEFGFRKNLATFGSFFNNLFVEGNYAKIDSEVTIGKDNPENRFDSFIQDATSDERPMQGQSPYVINLQLGYDNLNTGRSAVLAFNEFGERITSIGINGNPDIYEQPRQKLDFILKWQLNDTFDVQRKKIAYTVSFKAENLLNSEIIWEQGNEEVLREEVGREYKLSFSAKY